MIKLNRDVEFIIERMNKSGERADIVGGCVRDFLLGKAPDDFDITTSASPEKTKEIFADFKTVDTGIKHGTVTLVLNHTPYEITTYRIDGEYKDNRRPESVTFSKKIEDDLGRRDFTMNAISYNPRDGITDPFGGAADIKKGVIRAVGDAGVRFTEDALRILRAIRFSARLGFRIEKITAQALTEKRRLLENVSAERIFVEWKKLLEGDFARGVIEEYLSVITVFLPELAPLSDKEIPRLDSLSASERAILLFRLAGIDSEKYAAAMSRLKTDNAYKSHGKQTLDCIAFVENNSPNLEKKEDLTILLYNFGENATKSALNILAILGKADKASCRLLSKMLEEGIVYKLSDLAVDGKDLIALGIYGKQIGSTLDSLLRRVMSGELKNEREELLASVK